MNKLKQAKRKPNNSKGRSELIHSITKKSNALYASPLGNAVQSIYSIYRSQEPDVLVLADQLGKQMKSVAEKGETYLSETLLITQAQTLQAIFHFAAEKIALCDSMTQLQIYTDMAVKANNACRKTLLAVNDIKHPQAATFIKNQNNAINQQINQDLIVNSKNSGKKPANELLSEVPHETLDSSRKGEAGTINSSMEAMAKSRRKNRNR